MSSLFSPKWQTTAGLLANATENDILSIQLSTIDDSTFTGVSNSTSFVFDEANLIETVSVNSTPTSFTVSNSAVVTVPFYIKETDVVYLTSNTQVIYSLLHDSLPNGISLSNTGLISGRVLSLTSPNLNHDFTIRASNGERYRDRRFSIIVNPIPSVESPPTWGNYSESIYTDNAVSFSYISLGSTTRGVFFDREIEIFQSSGLSASVELLPFILIDAPFNTLPDGLSISGKIISGIIDSTNNTGDYFFKLKILDYNGDDLGGDNIRIFKITITTPENQLAPLSLVNWETPAGALGSLNENEPSPFTLTATSTIGELVKYRLKDDSYLPAGFLLDELTGEIRGVAAHVAASTTSTFAVRAFIDTDTFADRTFAITVVTRYNSTSIVSISIPMLSKISTTITSYIDGLIPSDDIFRLGDPYYGVKDDLSMYVVSGLSPLDNYLSIIKTSNYKAPVKLILGAYKVSNVMVNGVHVYDVLYREVIDPHQNADGFTLINNVPMPSEIRKSITGEIVYQTSIDNIRYDAIDSFSFPTDNADLRYVQGYSGVENLPQWMRSEGKFIKAIPIAYLKPSKGNLVLKNITFPAEDPFLSNPLSYGFSFDAYNYTLEVQEISAETTFDGQQTTFDALPIKFDELAYYNGFKIFINN